MIIALSCTGLRIKTRTLFMKLFNYFLFPLVLLFGSTAQAAVLNTAFGYLHGQYGSEYPSLSGSSSTTDVSFSDIYSTGFGSGHYASTPNPNFGWIDWNAWEEGLLLSAGQDVDSPWNYDYEGFGFSQLDFLWGFTVDGDDAVLNHDILRGTGSGEALLFDLTAFSTSSYLSAECLGCADDNIPSGGSVDLLDEHIYFLGVSLENRSASDGWEVDYILTLSNATIALADPMMSQSLSTDLNLFPDQEMLSDISTSISSVPEPGFPLIFSSGLAVLLFVRDKRRRA
jgi:hypothetical protein